MNQKLTHTLGEFCLIDPKSIFALPIAAHSRFAKAEESALRTMRGEALQILGDHNTLAAYVRHAIPQGPSGDQPLVQYLCLAPLIVRVSTCNFPSNCVLLL